VNAKDPGGRDTLLEYAIVATFVIQELEPEVFKVAKLTCTMITLTDEFLTSYGFGRALVTGPTEDGTDDIGYLFAKAALACKGLP